MPKFKGRRKQGPCKCYKSRKYKHCKPYISPATTTITNQNDNINKIITYLVTLAVVIETFSTILTVINVQKVLIELMQLKTNQQ